MIAKPSHGLGLAPHSCHVEPFALDERDRYVAVEPGVARQVNALLGTFTEEAHEFVAPTRENGRHLLARHWIDRRRW